MADTRFKALTRRLTLGGGLAALTGIGPPLSIGDMAAKKRKKKRKKKKKGPQEFADAACPFVAGSGLAGSRRYAQTFIALRNGKLTRAEFGLRQNVEGESFVVEIREVDAANVPDTVIATMTVANIPATEGSDSPRTISATFANPPTVVTGLRYALSVTAEGDLGYTVHTNANDNECPDEFMFRDAQADGDFQPIVARDMIFATFVTA